MGFENLTPDGCGAVTGIPALDKLNYFCGCIV